MTGDEAIAAAIRAGCQTSEIHLTCSYPDCSCRMTPVIVRSAITEWRKLMPPVKHIERMPFVFREDG